jgi:hypothetical protein
MSTLVRLLLIALVGGGALAVAGDQAAARPGQETTPPATEVSKDPAEPTPSPTPTPTAAPEEQLEEFVPTEKLPADQAVAFPVDI